MRPPFQFSEMPPFQFCKNCPSNGKIQQEDYKTALMKRYQSWKRKLWRRKLRRRRWYADAGAVDKCYKIVHWLSWLFLFWSWVLCFVSANLLLKMGSVFCIGLVFFAFLEFSIPRPVWSTDGTSTSCQRKRTWQAGQRDDTFASCEIMKHVGRLHSGGLFGFVWDVYHSVCKWSMIFTCSWRHYLSSREGGMHNSHRKSPPECKGPGNMHVGSYVGRSVMGR